MLFGRTIIEVKRPDTEKRSKSGQPFLTFYYHNQHSQTISYGWGKWEACEKDMIRVKASMMEIEKTLEVIPLTEPDKPVTEVKIVAET